MLVPSIQKTLHELSQLIGRLSIEEYCRPCEGLSNATIGEHSRHIIELFQCLDNQYETGIVNYDNRKRDFMIQTDTSFAISALESIHNCLEKPNKTLQIQQILDGEELIIETNYHRELLYNLEHCIHHQALIKVAIITFDSIKVDENFGVARSTIEYRKQCAQ
jgi:hypothetical protein